MIDLTTRGDCAVIILNRPRVLNALSFDGLGRLENALDQVARSDHRALIVTGAGSRAFCSGADIEELRGRTAMECRRDMRRGQGIFQRLENLPLPSVAAINGWALGGGLELALACTFRVAHRQARLGMPEIRLGLIPGYGGTQRLPRLLGQARARQLILTGQPIDAERAEAIGLVDRITDGDVVEAALALAGELTRLSLPALALAREAIRRAGEVPLVDGLAAEAELGALAFSLHDATEGIVAFQEKRPARFRDR
jgi:enoyl-CoA hydratase